MYTVSDNKLYEIEAEEIKKINKETCSINSRSNLEKKNSKILVLSTETNNSPTGKFHAQKEFVVP